MASIFFKHTNPRIPTPKMLLETMTLDYGMLALAFFLAPAYKELTLKDRSEASSPLSCSGGISLFSSGLSEDV